MKELQRDCKFLVSLVNPSTLKNCLEEKVQGLANWLCVRWQIRGVASAQTKCARAACVPDFARQTAKSVSTRSFAASARPAAASAALCWALAPAFLPAVGAVANER